jgi:1,4-dihydroxy-2-naphthoate octaprenyltransferase
VTPVAAGVAVPVGLLACAILVANNLRDIPTDGEAGKRTLAVRLGTHRTRQLYSVLVLAPFAVPVVLAVTGHRWCLLALVTLPLAVPPVRLVTGGATGRELIAVLKDTGRVHLAYGIMLGIGLAVH